MLYCSNNLTTKSQYINTTKSSFFLDATCPVEFGKGVSSHVYTLYLAEIGSIFFQQCHFSMWLPVLLRQKTREFFLVFMSNPVTVH